MGDNVLHSGKYQGERDSGEPPTKLSVLVTEKREEKFTPPPPKQKSIHMFFTFNIQIFDTAGTAAVAAAAPAPLLQDRPWVEDRAKSVTHWHQCFGADQPRIFAGGRQVSGQG